MSSRHHPAKAHSVPEKQQLKIITAMMSTALFTKTVDELGESRHRRMLRLLMDLCAYFPCSFWI